MEEVGLRETGRTGLVEGCWVREEDLLQKCLVWMKSLAVP